MHDADDLLSVYELTETNERMDQHLIALLAETKTVATTK